MPINPTLHDDPMPALPQLTVYSIQGVAVSVPMARPLGTSAQTISHAPLLLIDLLTEEGITGRSYLFCYVPSAAGAINCILKDLSARLKGKKVVPLEINQMLHQAFRLIGVRGVVSMAIAGVDVACWDALALAAGMPLATLLGSSPRALPAYNSNGLGLMAPDALADEALELLENGFKAVKLRLGRPQADDDLLAVRTVRKRLPSEVALMVDYNQALSWSEARKRCQMLDDEGIYWIEEPLRHDDYAGYAQLSREFKTPMQLGENFAGQFAMADAIQAKSSRFMMPDLERIGGVTGWLRAGALASAAGIDLSTHLFPEVSAHLLAATPTAHWLEYVDWANPILKTPLTISDGMAHLPDSPGAGLAWNDDAVAKYKI